MHPSLLLRLYSSTIKSILEYAAGLVDPGTVANWARLQKLCNSGLRTCLRAMPSTPICSLQVEAGDWPLHLRYAYLTDRLLLRWRTHPTPTAYTNLREVAPRGTPRPRLGRAPLLVQRFVALPAEQPHQHPPLFWPCYDLHWQDWVRPLPAHMFFPPVPLTGVDVEDLAATYQHLKRTAWAGRHTLATDGSRAQGPDGTVTVGAALVDESGPVQSLFRLPDLATVFTAELYALQAAVQRALLQGLPSPLLLSDSLSAIQAISSGLPSATTPSSLIAARRGRVEAIPAYSGEFGKVRLLRWRPLLPRRCSPLRRPIVALSRTAQRAGRAPPAHYRTLRRGLLYDS